MLNCFCVLNFKTTRTSLIFATTEDNFFARLIVCELGNLICKCLPFTVRTAGPGYESVLVVGRLRETQNKISDLESARVRLRNLNSDRLRRGFT